MCMFNFYTEKESVGYCSVDGVKADYELRSPYYLSDVVVEEFQPDSVGKIQNRKYIILFVKPTSAEGSISIFEILELTETSLIVKHINADKVLEFKIEVSETK